MSSEETRLILAKGEKLLSKRDAMGCPFCGAQPTIQPWHGGGPRKRLVSCSSEDCHINPSVTGSTPFQARKRWNTRAIQT